MAKSTAPTVIMPPNPVFARLINTVTFPFDLLPEAWVALSAHVGSLATRKTWKSTFSTA
jgi:hypothetical protein